MADEGDPMMRVAIFGITFTVVMAILISGLGGILNTEDSSSARMSPLNFDTQDFTRITWWTNAGNANYTLNVSEAYDGFGTYFITPSNVAVAGTNILGQFEDPNTDCGIVEGSRWESGSYSGNHAVRLYPMTNGDWVVYRQGDGWDRWTWWINARDIAEAATQKTDGSWTAQMHASVGVGVSVVFFFPSTTTSVLQALQDNGIYYVAVGQDTMDQISVTTDVWSVVGKLLTFSSTLSGVWWIDGIVSTCVWASIIFTAFYMINRLLDHIPFT